MILPQGDSCLLDISWLPEQQMGKVMRPITVFTNDSQNPHQNIIFSIPNNSLWQSGACIIWVTGWDERSQDRAEASG